MSLDFLNQTPDRAIKRIVRDLITINPRYLSEVEKLKNYSVTELKEHKNRLDGNVRKQISESSYGTWLKTEKFVETKLLSDLVDLLREFREGQISKAKFVRGLVYYKDVNRFGTILEGKRYMYEGAMNKYTGWVNFRTPVAVAKACEVIRHGSDEDFKKIYVEMANGSMDALHEVSINHITESSRSALKSIEQYCDSRWSGPWPWEVPAPWALQIKLEENRKMRNRSINEMRYDLSNLITSLFEGEMDRFELINKAKEMSGRVDKMIADLGTISGDSVEAAASYGGSASSLGTTIQEPLNNAAHALSELKAAIDKAVTGIEGGGSGGDDMMGSPEDAMGGEPDMGMGDDQLPDTLSDLDMDGSDERPKKGI